MRACEILPRILIDNLHCFKHTWNSNVDAYHGKWAFMPSSVLELLANFKSTYFASMNPPIASTLISIHQSSQLFIINGKLFFYLCSYHVCSKICLDLK